MRYGKKETEESIETLRKILAPNDTVYTIIRSVSRSGMSRAIDLYAFIDGDKRYLSGYAATAMGYARDKNGALKVSGCGMDMGFAVVYELGRILFPKGFTPTRPRNGDISGHDADGGYALRQEWI